MDLNITPYPGKIWIKLEEMKLGGISLKGENLVSEVGIVVISSSDWCKPGDRVYFKAWGLDNVEVNGETYYVADIDSKAILGKENV